MRLGDNKYRTKVKNLRAYFIGGSFKIKKDVRKRVSVAGAVSALSRLPRCLHFFCCGTDLSCLSDAETMDSNGKGVQYYEAKFSFAPSDCWHAAAPFVTSPRSRKFASSRLDCMRLLW
jgi:hypothetical protein